MERRSKRRAAAVAVAVMSSEIAGTKRKLGSWNKYDSQGPWHCQVRHRC